MKKEIIYENYKVFIRNYRVYTSVAPKFQQGIKAMGNSRTDDELKAGLGSVIDAIKDSGMYGDDVIADVSSIISGDFEKNIANSQLRSVFELFQDEELRAIYKSSSYNPLSVQMLTSEDSIEYTKNIVDSILDRDSPDVIRSKFTQNNNELIRRASKGNTAIINSIIAEEGSILENTNTNSFHKIIKVNNLESNAILKNMITGEEVGVFGTKTSSIDDILSNNYKVLLGNEKDEALSIAKEGRKSERLFKNALFKTPEDTMSTIIGSEIYDDLDGLSKNERNNLINKVAKNNNLKYTDVNRAIVKNNLSGNKLFKTLNSNYTESDKDMLKLSYNKLENFYNSKQITRTEFSDTLKDINDSIIERGIEAKAKRAQLNSYLETKSIDIAKRNTKAIGINDVKKSIEEYKIFDIDSMKNSYMTMLSENKERVLSEFIDGDIAKEVILQSEELTNANIKNAKIYNEAVGFMKTKNYADNYDYKGGREKLLNWNNSTKAAVDNINNKGRKISDKSFKKLSNAKIGFGEYADLSLIDLDLDTLKELSNTAIDSADKNVRALMEESQSNINAYIKHIVNNKESISDEYKNISKNITRISKPLDEEFGVEAMNKKLLDIAEKRKFERTKAFKETIDDTAKYIDDSESAVKKLFQNKYFVTAGAIGAGAVALSLLGGKRNINSGSQDSAQPVPKENKEKGRPVVYEAPSSPENNNRAMLQGLSMKIRGKSNNEIDKKGLGSKMANIFRTSVGNEVNINTREEDNKDEVSDSWIKEKISKIIN